jgi:hypothetical protein
MGMMKRFLEKKIAEYARVTGWSEEEIYADDEKYALAQQYADKELKKEANNNVQTGRARP